jgi:hypothetical protein
MLPYRISDRSLSVLLGGQFRTIPSESINFQTVVERLRAGDATEQEILELVDVKSYVSKVTSGRVEITENSVLFNGTELNGYMVQRTLEHLHKGDDTAPLAAFIDNLMDNPNEEVREDLFKWIESGDMAITEDGCFLAYKYVLGDYYSAHSGKNGRVFHGLGTFVTMPRSECDPSRNNTCSTGLHFCSYGYLGQYNQSHRIIIVKVHPSNVTAIPRDYHNQKGRCCAYTVVGELPAEEVKDILRGRRVVRSFSEFKIGTEVVSGDDELLKAPVEVGDFELDEEDDVETPVDEEDVTPIVSPPRAAKPKAEKKKKGKKAKSFEHKGLRFTAKKILKLVADHGQRGASRITGVPRTTIQTWIAAING